MARALISIIRHLPKLRIGYRFSAIELAHRADRSGTVHMSHSYHAHKIGGCTRTAQRHIEKLIDLGILRKTVTRLAKGLYAWNTYTFLIPFDRNTAHPFSIDTSSSRKKSPMDNVSTILPDPEGEKEKTVSLSEEIRRLRRGMTFLDPDGEHYADALAQVTRLEGLQARTGGAG